MFKVNSINEFQMTSCASCGMDFAVPNAWHEDRMKKGLSFHCPNGHLLSFTPSENENEKTAQQLAEALRENVDLSARVATLERQLKRRAKK